MLEEPQSRHTMQHTQKQHMSPHTPSHPVQHDWVWAPVHLPVATTQRSWQLLAWTTTPRTNSNNPNAHTC